MLHLGPHVISNEERNLILGGRRHVCTCLSGLVSWHLRHVGPDNPLCNTYPDIFRLRLFRRTFGGVTSIDMRITSELQEAIEAVAKAFGWTLDKDNIQRNAYGKRF